MTGFRKDAGVDEYDRKEYLRKNRRRPIQETIDEMGEGRGEDLLVLRSLAGNSSWLIRLISGIYAPGYEERRRERIRAKYGIEVPSGPPSQAYPPSQS